MTKKSTLFSKVLNLGLFTVLSVVSLPISGCGDDESAPGADKYCLTKVINYHPKWNQGDQKFETKNPEFEYGTVKADGNGKCPTPEIEWKNQ
jgi:hypothetical protein